MIDMYNEAFLCYINAKDDFFENIDFNFDSQYIFHIEVDKSQIYYSYILHVSKRKNNIQPRGFWGKNISAMHVITGQNGAGKTSILKFIINNIGSATTAMNREGVIYIVNQSGTYIVFHNCRTLLIDKNSDAEGANIILEKEYYEALRVAGKYTAPFDNRRFWKHIIFFSNYFGSAGILKEDGYVINVSKDKEICEMINSFDNLSELSAITIQSAYQNYRNTKILGYIKDGLFEEDEIKEIISIPNLVHFKLLYSIKDYGNLYEDQKDRFPNEKWIGKKRYPQFCSGLILSKDREFEFEAAINKFSVDMMFYLLQKQLINQAAFEAFIDELAETEHSTGIEIARNKLQLFDNVENKKWISILDFLANENKKFVLYWQSSDEFVYKWSIDDIELVENLVKSNKADSFFSCDLVGSERNGFYSSGEESKINFFVSLFDAISKMKEANKLGHVYNNNVILVLDELDAYFHPKYQIDLVYSLLKMVSKIFKDYYVQVIMTSNTPLELSDFPSSNIIYLEHGKIIEENNEIESFGSNVCSLLKNSFYINSTMGRFAKKKIDAVIEFLLNKSCNCISKEEVKYIISIVGEPLIKNKLQEMYYRKYPEEIPSQDEEIAFYKRKILELQQHIMNGKNIDVRALQQLEEELVNLTGIINEIKG